MQYLLVFLEGLVTFVSPCLLPMLPIYVGYFMGGKTDVPQKRILFRAIGFVIGFTILFVLMGAFAGTIGRVIIKYSNWVNIIGGALIVLFGLVYLGIFNIPFFKGVQGKWQGDGFFSSFLMGIIFSIGWTPCVGAFLGSALVLASKSGSILQGSLMLFLYSLGLGVPFILGAVLMDKLKNVFSWLKKHNKVITMTAGGLLILLGIMMMTGLYGKIAALVPQPTATSMTSSENTGTQSTATEQTVKDDEPEITPAPDFKMQDINGKTVSLSDYYGIPIVLNFWASWCGPCQSEMPEFNKVAEELKGEVQFLMVNLTDGSRETVQKATKFVTDRGYTFPVFFDTQYDGASTYAVRSIPVTYFIDFEGNLQAYYPGAMSEAILRQGIAMITAQGIGGKKL